MLTKLSREELILVHTCTTIALYKGPKTEIVVTDWMEKLIIAKGNCREHVWKWCDADNILVYLSSLSGK